MRQDNIVNYKPSIKVYYKQNEVSEIDFREVLLGIEEEGIPYELKPLLLTDAIDLGYQASVDSTLGVGVGVDRENVVLHFNKLKKESPIYIIKFKNNPNKARAIGANAARLVIKVPFKELD